LKQQINIECWSRASAAQALGCDERMLDEIVSAGLVPVIAVARGVARKGSDRIVGEQFDYIAGEFVPLREEA
jgi:hypothetical protein